MVVVSTKPKVQLEVFELDSGNCKYQALAINLVEPTIEVSEMQVLKIPDKLNFKRGVILWGIAPNWLYNYLINCFYDVPWIACFNIQLHTAVVVSSHIPQFQPGDVIPINKRKIPGKAILICGAPDSGKSVLSHALRRSFATIKTDASVFLHRANWDGEGNHTLENPDTDLAKKLKNKNKFKIHQHPEADKLLPQYFKYHANAVQNIRQVVDLAFVDVGGKPEVVKQAVIDECSHYIVISKDAEAIENWHKLCGEKLKVVAVIHSVLQEKLQILKTEPFLEIVAGKWEKGVKVPDVLSEQILRVI
jgi:CRISPR-associated protein Csx3